MFKRFLMPGYKLLKFPFFGRFMVKWKNPLNEKEQNQWENVRFSSGSGAVLAGLSAPAGTKVAKATLVLGHPMGREAKAYFLKSGYTDKLRKNGFNILVFDFNGFGESTHGNFFYFQDILAAGKMASQIYPDLPIGYMGISLGGMWATIAFAQNSHPFEFAIIESAPASLKDFCALFPVYNVMLKLLSFLFPAYPEKVDMIKNAGKMHNLKGLLFIYSKADAWVPYKTGELYRKNSSVLSELVLFKNAKHASIGRSVHKDAYFQKIISFFNQVVEVQKVV